jgi:uncharacterized protein (DUF3820 family)
MPFGKHKGKSFSALPSGYLRWLCGEDWFEEKHEHLFEVAQDELRYRDEVGGHWEDN